MARITRNNGTRKRARQAKGSVLADVPEGLTPQQYEFSLVWLANSFNATAAYKTTHPNCKSDGAARVEGHRLLAHPNVRSFLRGQLEDRWKPFHMSGDEALARVAADAKADVRLLFDEAGLMRKPHEWPDEIADSIESVDIVNGKVKLVSKGAARRTILEVTGKVKGDVGGVDQLVEAMRLTLEKNMKKGQGK